MSALLTDNLPLLAGAPDGIKKLRELILELAVRGKLVPQDPSDEPASELLKRIAAEKARLVRETGLRTTAKDDVPEDERYLDLPNGWEFQRLGNLARFIDYRGRTPTKTQSGVPLITAKNVRAGYVSREPEEFIAEQDYEAWMTRGFPRAGDMLFTTEAPMGNIALVDIADRFALAQRVICFQLHDLKIGPFLRLAIMSSPFQGQLLDVATGMTATGVKSSRLKEIPVPLPPLPEQHRIVAKVDELMALCDRLEARQSDAESAHARLVQALLDSLTQASDAADFAASLQRLSAHFHSLFVTESSIDALKQSLLQLAVMGKLVPQDPNDEPAGELLKRIAEEKARLVAEGKIKRQKPLAEISAEEKPFDLPSGWEWSRLGQISSDVQYGFTASADHQGSEPLLLRITDIQGDKVNWASVPGCDISPGDTSGYELKDGDIVIARTGGTIGKSYLVDGLDKLAVFASYLIRIGRLDSACPKFTKVFLGSQLYWNQLYANSMGTGQPNVNGTALKGLLISLPPLAEQHRIVAKLDQLMSLCDQLKARLADARQLHERLAGALVVQAVA